MKHPGSVASHDVSRKRLLGLYGLIAVFGVLLFAVSLFFLVWQNIHQSKVDFRQLGFKVSESLQQSFVINETILDGFAAFLADVGIQEPYRARFYSRTMIERYSNLYMFQAAQRVKGADVEAFEETLSDNMGDDISVRRFEFGRGLVDVDVDKQSKGYFYPLVFVEPVLNSSINMLGLDISSIQFVEEAMDASLSSGLASISEGFELFDGNMAFVMIKPSLLPEQKEPDQYALLVVKTEALLREISLAKPGLQLDVRYQTLAPMVQKKTQPLADWESFIFPKLEYKNSFTLGPGRVNIRLSQQLGLDSLNLGAVIFIVLVCLFIGWMMSLFLRNHYQGEVDKLHANNKLYQLANYDRLTGLANRHYFEDYLIRSIATSKRRGGKIGLLYVDLNDFKSINDTYGHATGDKVLTITAAILLDCIRVEDVASRVGGDEFVILLEHITTLEDAQKVSTRIHDQMDGIEYVDNKSVKLSASIGFAMYPDEGETLDQLMHAADHNMYAAKRRGKVLSIKDHTQRRT
jgi:diguanylate cyclase (GGDEF)-like protein